MQRLRASAPGMWCHIYLLSSSHKTHLPTAECHTRLPCKWSVGDPLTNLTYSEYLVRCITHPLCVPAYSEQIQFQPSQVVPSQDCYSRPPYEKQGRFGCKLKNPPHRPICACASSGYRRNGVHLKTKGCFLDRSC